MSESTQETRRQEQQAHFTFDRADWLEAGRDIGATLAGGAVVLLAAVVGL